MRERERSRKGQKVMQKNNRKEEWQREKVN